MRGGENFAVIVEGPRLLEDHGLAVARGDPPRPLEALSVVRRGGMRRGILVHEDHRCSNRDLERRRRELEGFDRDRHRRRDLFGGRQDRRRRTSFGRRSGRSAQSDQGKEETVLHGLSTQSLRVSAARKGEGTASTPFIRPPRAARIATACPTSSGMMDSAAVRIFTFLSWANAPW